MAKARLPRNEIRTWFVRVRLEGMVLPHFPL